MKFKRMWIAAVSIIAVLAITNPTNSDFENYSKVNNRYTQRTARVGYYGIVSVFRSVRYNEYGGEEGKTYLGIFKNFIRIG